MKTARMVAVGALLMAAGGCGLEDQKAATLIAPSEFSLSVTATVLPDQLPRDGQSQAVVTALVRDARGQAVAGQRLSVSATVGTVTQSEVTTDSSGRASVGYTAPVASTVVGDGQAVIALTPLSGNAGDAVARTVSLRLTGTPNTGAPVAAFSFLPAAPERGQLVTFDASATTDEGVRCGDTCTYAWNFGSEASASGRTATYRFLQARTYAVTLTVTDATGTSTSATQSVAVVNPAAPTAVFTTSPSSPVILQNVNFVATGSAAAAGHTLALFDWSYGDGVTSSSTSASSSHAYATTGTYTVTLTVTDDVGQARTASGTVTVVNGLTANFSVSPSSPVINRTVNVSGADSTAVAGASIVLYQWDFGNGLTSSDSGATATTTYTTAGTYTIRLTVRDSAGRTATVTKSVTVTAS